VTAPESSTIARRYARLRDLPDDALRDGLDTLGERYLNGETSLGATVAAYLDETARRLAAK
jgi:hypothetical protein